MKKKEESKDKNKEKKYDSLLDVERDLLPNYFKQKKSETNNEQGSLVKNIFNEEMLKGIKV